MTTDSLLLPINGSETLEFCFCDNIQAFSRMLAPNTLGFLLFIEVLDCFGRKRFVDSRR